MSDGNCCGINFLDVFGTVAPVIVAVVGVWWGRRQWMNSNALRLHEIIEEAWKYSLDFLWESKDSKNDKEYTQMKRAHMERTLNAYEYACKAYLDGRVDRKRFRRDYEDSIKMLYRNGSFRKLLNMEDDYPAITEVHSRWEKINLD